MNFDDKRKQRLDFLIAVFEKAEGQAERDVSTKEVAERLGLDMNKVAPFGMYWKEKGFVKYNDFNWIAIPIGAIDEVEKLMEQTYRDKEYLVLKKIVEDARNKDINKYKLAEELSISMDDLQIILFDFNKKGWAYLTFETVSASPDGITALNKWNETHTNIRDIYHTNIYGNNSQVGGQGNTQNIQIITNPEFDSAIKSLLEIVKTSSLNDFIKEDAIANIKSFEQLAQKEKTPDLTEYAQKKIDLLKTTLEVGELALKVAPLIEIISKAF